MNSSPDFVERVRDCSQRLSQVGSAALGALFDLTAQRLVRFATTIAPNQQDAEDAVQTALARLASDSGRLAGLASPWAYLLRMVRNEVLLIVRRSKRCTTQGDLSDLVTRCAVDEMEREESHRAVWTALRTLPPEQAEVVVLKIWEGMTFAQIGEILEVSPHTAASRYQYAMEKLSKRLTAQRGALHHD